MKLNYFVIPAIAVATSWLGSWFTTQGMGWYETLVTPAWTPPGSVIGIIWTIIYILTAICALVFWNTAKRDKRFWWVISLFLLNAVLNAGWTYLYFYEQLIAAGIVEMLFLEATVIGLIVLIAKNKKKLSYLLYPYAIWVAIATYLAWSIFKLN